MKTLNWRDVIQIHHCYSVDILDNTESVIDPVKYIQTTYFEKIKLQNKEYPAAFVA